MTAPALLRVEEGVGRLRSFRRLGPGSPMVAAVIDSPAGEVFGVIDTRLPSFAALFAEGVAPVALRFREVDVEFRVEVRRSKFADPDVPDVDLAPSMVRRWLTAFSALDPAVLDATPAEADASGFLADEFPESQADRCGRAFTTGLRIALAGLAALPSRSEAA